MRLHNCFIGLLLAGILCFLHEYTVAQSISKNEQAIRSLLQQQTEAWNRGSIDEFMIGYLPTDSLIFIGKNGATFGYASTLQNYKKSYKDTAAMGKLRFELIRIQKINTKNYFVVGKWFLQRSIGNKWCI